MRRFYYGLRNFGFDPLNTLRAFKAFPRFIFNLLQFINRDRFYSKIRISPSLLDFNQNSGSADGHYFWQDLITARWINFENPRNHLDVGSRIDGFVAHLLSFREVTVLDIREGTNKIIGLNSVVGNAQSKISHITGLYSSVSSLHSIEHFGLGRYRDPIDPKGHLIGVRNIADCVEAGGSFYLSFPIGENAVEFNSQRIIDPREVIAELSDFEIIRFVLIPWKGTPNFDINFNDIDLRISGQAGLFHLRRTH